MTPLRTRWKVCHGSLRSFLIKDCRARWGKMALLQNASLLLDSLSYVRGSFHVRLGSGVLFWSLPYGSRFNYKGVFAHSRVYRSLYFFVFYVSRLRVILVLYQIVFAKGNKGLDKSFDAPMGCRYWWCARCRFFNFFEL